MSTPQQYRSGVKVSPASANHQRTPRDQQPATGDAAESLAWQKGGASWGATRGGHQVRTAEPVGAQPGAVTK